MWPMNKVLPQLVSCDASWIFPVSLFLSWHHFQECYDFLPQEQLFLKHLKQPVKFLNHCFLILNCNLNHLQKIHFPKLMLNLFAYLDSFHLCVSACHSSVPVFFPHSSHFYFLLRCTCIWGYNFSCEANFWWYIVHPNDEPACFTAWSSKPRKSAKSLVTPFIFTIIEITIMGLNMIIQIVFLHIRFTTHATNVPSLMMDNIVNNLFIHIFKLEVMWWTFYTSFSSNRKCRSNVWRINTQIFCWIRTYRSWRTQCTKVVNIRQYEEISLFRFKRGIIKVFQNARIFGESFKWFHQWPLMTWRCHCELSNIWMICTTSCCTMVLNKLKEGDFLNYWDLFTLLLFRTFPVTFTLQFIYENLNLPTFVRMKTPWTIPSTMSTSASSSECQTFALLNMVIFLLRYIPIRKGMQKFNFCPGKSSIAK